MNFTAQENQARPNVSKVGLLLMKQFLNPLLILRRYGKRCFFFAIFSDIIILGSREKLKFRLG
jgi:hypothetical protein